MTDTLNINGNGNVAYGRRRGANHLTTAADLIMAGDDFGGVGASFPYFDASSSSSTSTNVPPLPASGEPTFSSSRLLDRANSIRHGYGYSINGSGGGGHLPITGSSSDSAASLPSPTSPLANNSNSNTNSNNSNGGSYAAIYAGKQRRPAVSSSTTTVPTSVASSVGSNDRILVSSVTSSTSSAIGNNNPTDDHDHDTHHDTDAPNNDDDHNNNNTNDTNDGPISGGRHRIAVSYANDDDSMITPMPSFPSSSQPSLVNPTITRDTSHTDDDGDGAYAADFEDFDDDAKLLGVTPLMVIGSLPPASPEVATHSLPHHNHSHGHNNNGSGNDHGMRPQTDRNTMHKALLNLKSKSKSRGNLSRANSAQPARSNHSNTNSNDYTIRHVDSTLAPMIEPTWSHDSPKASTNMMMDDAPIHDDDTNATATDDHANGNGNGYGNGARTLSAPSTTVTPSSAAPRRRIVKKVRVPTIADVTAPTTPYANSNGHNDISPNNAYLVAGSSPYDIPANVGPTGAQSVPPSPAAKPISGPSVTTHNGFGGSRLMEEDDDIPMSDAERARMRLERLADRDMNEKTTTATVSTSTTAGSTNGNGARLRPPRFDLSDANTSNDQVSPTPISSNGNGNGGVTPAGIIKRGASPQPRGRVRFAAEDRIAAAAVTAASRLSPSRAAAGAAYHSANNSNTSTPVRSISLPQSVGASPMDARDRALIDQPLSARMDISARSSNGTVAGNGPTSRRNNGNGNGMPDGASIPLNHDDIPVGPQRRRKSAHPVLIHEQASAAAAAAAVLGTGYHTNNNNNGINDVPGGAPSMISSVSQPAPTARRGRRSSIPNNIPTNTYSGSGGGNDGHMMDYDDEDRQAEPLSSANIAATAMTPKHGVHLSTAPSPVPRTTRGLRSATNNSNTNANTSDDDISYRMDRAAELAAFGGRESRSSVSGGTHASNGGGITGRRAATATATATTPKEPAPGFGNGDDVPVGVRRGQRATSAVPFDSGNELSGMDMMPLPMAASPSVQTNSNMRSGRRPSVAAPTPTTTATAAAPPAPTANVEYGSYVPPADDDINSAATMSTSSGSSYAEMHQAKQHQQQRRMIRKKVVGDVVKGGQDAPNLSPLTSPQGEYKIASLFTASATNASLSSSSTAGSVSSTAHVGSTTVIPDRRPGTTKKTLRQPQYSDDDMNAMNTNTSTGPPLLNTNLDSPPQGMYSNHMSSNNMSYSNNNGMPYRSPTGDRRSNLDPSSAYRSGGTLSAASSDAMELESVPSSSLPPSPKPHGLHPSAYQQMANNNGGNGNNGNGMPPAHPRLSHGHHYSISEPLSPPQSGTSAMISSTASSSSTTASTMSGMPPPHRRIRRPGTVNGEGFSNGAPMTPSSTSGNNNNGNNNGFGVPPLRGGVPSPSSASGERALGAAARAMNPYANIPSTPGGTMMSSTPALGTNEPRTPGNRARITAGRRVSVSQTSGNGMDTGRSDGGASSSASVTPVSGIPADYKGNDAEYIPSSQLKPCRAPKEELKTAFTAIKSTDWSVRFNGINTLRQIAVHHTDHLMPHVRACVRDLRPEVDSLRSSLAKNSMMCLCDMFQQCKRGMDNELVAIVPSLLRRAGEATGFLAEEGCRALEEMIRGVTESKSLAILITHASNGNKVIKQMAAVFLDKAVEILGSRVVQSKEYASLIKTIGLTFSGASAPMRVAARNSVLRLAKLVGVIELETTMKRAMTPQQFAPIKKVLDQGVNQDLNLGGPPVARVRVATAKRGVVRRFAGNTVTPATPSAAGGAPGDDEGELAVGGLPSYSYAAGNGDGGNGNGGDGDDDDDIGAASADFADVQSFPPRSLMDARGTQSSYSDPGSSLSVRSTTSYKSGLGSLRAAAGRNMFEKKIPARTGEEVEQLSAVFTEMSASDFRQRANGIQRLLAFVECYNETANDQVGRLFDQFLPRLGDSNSKVQLASLAALEKLVPSLRDNMTSVVQLLVPALAANLASTNAAVKKATQETMSLIMMSLDETILLQSFANAVTFGNARVKPLMIEKLDELCVRVYRSKPNLVTRHVIPVAFSLIDDTKPDIRSANRRLLQRLHSLMGDSLLDPTLTAKLSSAAIAKVRALLTSTDGV